MKLAGGIRHPHGQGMEDGFLRLLKAFVKIIFLGVLIKQKTDRSPVHAINRFCQFHGAVQTSEHEAIAAENDDDVGFFRRA